MKHTPLFIGLALAFGAFAACSSGDSNTTGASSTGGVDTGCIGDPFACAAGQTCWASQHADFFECIKSGPGKAGDSCTNTYDFASCGDGLTCFTVPSFPQVCTPFCDPMQPDKGCKDGLKCQGLRDKASQAVFYACAPKQEGAGGGGTGGSGGSSSASSTAASSIAASSVAASSVAASSAGPSSSSTAASGAGGASSSSGGAGGTGG